MEAEEKKHFETRLDESPALRRKTELAKETMAALSNAPEALAMPGDHASGRRPTRVHALRMAAAFAIAATLVLAIAVSWLGVQDLQLRARVAALEEMRQNQRASRLCAAVAIPTREQLGVQLGEYGRGIPWLDAAGQLVAGKG